MKFISTLLLNFYYLPLFVVVTLIALLCIPIGAAAISLLTGKPLSLPYRRGVQWYGRVLIKLIPFWAPVRVQNKAGKLPVPAVFVTNHSSSADPFCFAVLHQDIAFLTSWPFDIPLFRGIMKHAQYIDTRAGWESVREQGLGLLKQRCSLIIWPEGHRSKDGSLGPFQRGAFHLACESGLPLVPVCIVNTGKLLPPGRHFLTPARPKVILLPPVWPQNDARDRKYMKSLSMEVRNILKAELQNHAQTDLTKKDGN